jgi:hypothetical protein
MDWADRTLALDPKHLFAREMKVGCYWKRGEFDRQLEESIAHARTFGVGDDLLRPLRDAFEREGRRGVLAYAVEQILQSPQPAQHLQLAILHAELGSFDHAFESLSRAIDGRDPALIYLAVGPQFDDLRNDARFTTCLTRVGLNRK